jgi:hypothetical protein
MAKARDPRLSVPERNLVWVVEPLTDYKGRLVEPGEGIVGVHGYLDST